MYGWQKEDEREAYQGLAMGAKMEGIMESLAEKAHSSLQRGEKNMCQIEEFKVCKDPTLVTGLL